MDQDDTTGPLPPFRCFGSGTEIYERYHDQEWGRPVVDERALFERLCLESFQSGLSWLVILRKREGFRRAFAGFDPAVVAGFGPQDVQRLLADADIVRNRAKIEATIANAAATLALSGQGLSLRALLWDLRPATDGTARKAAERLSDLPGRTEETTLLARRMKRLGFRFLGPTTLYSALQACGIVNDHLGSCPVRGDVEALRATVTTTTG